MSAEFSSTAALENSVSRHSSDDMRRKRGVFPTRCQCACVVISFVCVTVAVGLMAGLIPDRSCPEPEVEDPGTPTTEPTLQPWLDPFLPGYIYPVHYRLYQYPDFYYDAATFSGQVTMDIKVDEPARHILVHIKDMDISRTEVWDNSTGNILAINRTFAYVTNQYWVVELQELIQAGSVIVLDLDFSGRLDNGIVGYYKSTYVNADTGEQRWLATSKFQPADSRKAFPNFDEPRFKAQFTVTLRHWQNFTALGNMPVATFRDLDSTWRETTFERTRTQSSYLICFIVCDFNYWNQTLSLSRAPLRMWAQPDKLDQAEYGLNISKSVADSLEGLFGEFHLPKLDSLAVPDYPSGATEHWGLITYRVGRVLYDPEQVGDEDKQSVVKIVAHEMAHNYFGNLVTCYWWDDLWLNEGFASYYEYKEAEKAEPDMKTAGQMVVRDMQSIMQTDGSSSSRPLLIEIKSPNEANAAFDGITYDKGSSMLRMMEGFLTEPVFLQGVNIYLNEHQYGSVRTQDLWDAMQQAVTGSQDITQIMLPWVYQSGLPVIHVRIVGSNLEATQSRFLKDPDADPTQPPSQYNYLWHVPLNYKTSQGTGGLIWLAGVPSVSFPNPTAGASDWIKFNSDQYMYFRVNYEDNLFQRIIDAITTDYTVFTPIDRANLLDDSLNIARASMTPYPEVLNFTMYMTSEVDYEPWRSARNGLGYISHMLYFTGNYSLFRTYIQTLSTVRMNKLQVKDSGSHMEKLNRQDIIHLSCGHGYSECLQNTTRHFTFWIQNDTSFPVDLNIRRVVYAYGMQRSGEDEEFDVMWSRYVRATSSQEADNILYGITWTTRLWLIQRLLDYSMDETKIRSQDFFTVIGYIADNMAANSYLWDWARANYDTIVARFGLESRSLGKMVPNIVSGYSTQFQLQEVEDFYTARPDPGTGAQARTDSLDSIRNNIKWRSRSEKVVIQWLVDKYGGSK